MVRYACFQDSQQPVDIVPLRTLLFMAASPLPFVISAEVVNAPGSVLSYKNLSYSIKAKAGQKQLIDDVSVEVRAGELLAIMVHWIIHISKFSLIDNSWMTPRDHPEQVRRSQIRFSARVVDSKPRKEHIAGSHVFQEDANAGWIGQYPSGRVAKCPLMTLPFASGTA